MRDWVWSRDVGGGAVLGRVCIHFVRLGRVGRMVCLDLLLGECGLRYERFCAVDWLRLRCGDRS